MEKNNYFSVKHVLYGVFAGICLGWGVSHIISDIQERRAIAEVQRKASETIARYEQHNQRARDIVEAMANGLSSDATTLTDTVRLIEDLQTQMQVLRDIYTGDNPSNDWDNFTNDEALNE